MTSLARNGTWIAILVIGGISILLGLLNLATAGPSLRAIGGLTFSFLIVALGLHVRAMIRAMQRMEQASWALGVETALLRMQCGAVWFGPVTLVPTPEDLDL